ncbi:hypothetical protein Angca_007395, partial [Angiostrongylus cantonensis]
SIQVRANKSSHRSGIGNSELAAHEGVYISEPAKRLPKTGRLLCFVLTSPKFYSTRVLAVNQTWLPRCDHGQFFANVPMDPTIPHSTVLNHIPDDYKHLFQKSMISFHYAFTRISDQFDWYFKADDDTYVIMEHMYEYLATLDPTEPYYLGYTLRPYFKRGYNGGGAGYVLSRAALKLFIDRVFFDRILCPFQYNEDVGIARCLYNVEVFPHDTRNEKRQPRFNTYHPSSMLRGVIPDEWHYYKPRKGRRWIAPELITFHHVSAEEILTFDDLLYRMRSPQLSKITKSTVTRTIETKSIEKKWIETKSTEMKLTETKLSEIEDSNKITAIDDLSSENGNGTAALELLEWNYVDGENP